MHAAAEGSSLYLSLTVRLLPRPATIDRAVPTRRRARLTHPRNSRRPCWLDERDRVLIACVDALHDTARLDDQLYAEVAALLSEAEILDLLMLCGCNHAISFAANGTEVPLEDGAPRFSDYQLLATDVARSAR